MGVSDFLRDAFSALFNFSEARSVLIGAILLAAASLFIYGFYISTSKRNIIDLNLRQYNYSSHPVAKKFFAIVYFFVEYILLMPILLFLWFAGLAIVLFLVSSESTGINQILFTSAVLVGAIRILAYIKRDVANDLGKLFPFMALSIFLLSGTSVFNSSLFWLQVQQVPSLVSNLFSYVLVIFGIEIFLRAVFTVYAFWSSEDINAMFDDVEKEE